MAGVGATITLAAVLGIAGASVADTLLLEGIEGGQETAHLRPVRGMTMERVESTFGQPVSKRAAVGDPPITRWEYTGFVVYFEYDHVIHAVTKRVASGT